MRLKNYFQKNGATGIFLAASLLMLTSCGSYDYVSYDDGIYGETRSQRNYDPQPSTTETGAASNYYSNYFSEKSAQIDNAIEQDAIFTDVDAYSSENYNPSDTTGIAQNYEGGQPAWGSDYDEVSVNIVNTGWNNWGWNAGWGPGFGLGWNNWGWNAGWGPGFGLGWNNWGWNAGFGFGNPYWYGGGFWCPPYYNNGFGFYGRNRIAYNRGFRNRGFRNAYAGNYRSRGAYNNRSRSRSYNNRNSYNNRRRISADNNRRTRNSAYSNGTRSRNNGTYSRSRSSSSNRSGTRTYNSGSRSRNSSGTRSYSGSSRSRSSGSVRSSRSSSGRSSGSRSGGSRGGRSRGGRG